MNETLPVWRSLLYVPTHVEKFVASAHTRGSDAVILDLEDAVQPDAKVDARDGWRRAVFLQPLFDADDEAGGEGLARFELQVADHLEVEAHGEQQYGQPVLPSQVTRACGHCPDQAE